MLRLVPLLLAAAAAAAPCSAQGSIDVFLDCQAPGCDTEHFRSEIPWVNWVRERTVADVHVLVTAESAGGGGRSYQLAFLGARSFAADTTTLRLDAPQHLTGSERRDLLTARLGQGLLLFASRTAAADRLRVVYDAGADVVTPATARDPWKSWVFSTRLEVALDGESREASHELELSVDASRVTAGSRLEFEVEGSYEEDRFQLRSGEQRFITRNWAVETLATRALAEHWSGGLAAETGRSTFENQDLYVRPAAVLEYSFYPYDEFSRRRLTLQYTFGGRYFDYTERTIYERLDERRFDQRIELEAEYQQPWGSASSGLSASHYLHDLSRYRVTGEVGLFLRLFRGFTLDVNGEYSRVHDQLYIPAGDADDEEILLRRRALETNYRYRTSIGIRYSFGSIYNNVVNPRIR